jgi:DNA polymerase-3 subunit gamma/tau
MSLALYRKYRPDTFQDLIGQEQTTKPIIKAIENNAIKHAYIFSGPRGCGKTTSARIFARCLNCSSTDHPVTTPCGKCESCIELASNGPGSVDVLEIDAASHNGVDDARDLREKLGYTPVRDRYKIVILDEAHRITANAFDALLKIVEEPPEHIKFVFVTTDPTKVLSTIRSRSYEYPFRLVDSQTMNGFLNEMLEKEQLKVEDGVLDLVIRAGAGSVRDTLSVLDQVAASNENGLITYEITSSLLGYLPFNTLVDILQAIGNSSPSAIIEQLTNALDSGVDFKVMIKEILNFTSNILLIQSNPNLDSLGAYSLEQFTALKQIATTIAPATAQNLLTETYKFFKNFDDTLLPSNLATVYAYSIITTPVSAPAVNTPAPVVNKPAPAPNEDGGSRLSDDSSVIPAQAGISSNVTQPEIATPSARNDNAIAEENAELTNTLENKIELTPNVKNFVEKHWNNFLDEVKNNSVPAYELLKANAYPTDLGQGFIKITFDTTDNAEQFTPLKSHLEAALLKISKKAVEVQIEVFGVTLPDSANTNQTDLSSRNDNFNETASQTRSRLPKQDQNDKLGIKVETQELDGMDVLLQAGAKIVE